MRGRRDRPDPRHRRPRQDLRRHPGPRRPRPHRRRGGGARLPRPQRRRQVDHDPLLLGLLRTDAGRCPAARAATRGATRARIHRRLAYVPGDVTPVAQPLGGRGDRPAAAAARVEPRRRPAARSCSSGSTSTPPSGAAPTPRATARRSRWSRRSPPTSTCCVLDEPTSGLDPLMEAGLRRLPRRAGPEQGTTVLLSSHILARSSGSATGSPSSAPGARSRAARWPSCGTCAGRKVVGRARRPGARPGRRSPGVHDLVVDGRPGQCSVEPEAIDGVARRPDRRRRPVAHQRPAHAGGAVPRRPTGDRGRRRRDEQPYAGTGVAHCGPPCGATAAGVASGWRCCGSSSTRPAAATSSLYPTRGRPGRPPREAINASPAVVALYGPILDVNTVAGELA